MDKLASSSEKLELVTGTFSDLSKAFDTVDHMLLSTKLLHYGIKENALKYFTNNLSEPQASTMENDRRILSLTWAKTTFYGFFIVSHLNTLQYDTLFSFTLFWCLK